MLVSGPTGVGKSTLLGVVTGLVPRFSGGRLDGDVLLDGESIVRRPPRERAHVVGYVGQDPAAGFVTDTVEEELAYGMEQLGLPADTMRRRVEETLDLLGHRRPAAPRPAHALGRQQQRVAIGSVLTMHPRLLVLDEPTSALDPTAAEDVLATLTRLVHDLGVSVLLAEHRLERVVPFADRMVLLTGDGRACASGRPPTCSPRRRSRRRSSSSAGPPAGPRSRSPSATPAAGPAASRPPRPAARPRRRGPTGARLQAGGSPSCTAPPWPLRDVDLVLGARHGHRPDGAQRLGQVDADLGPAGERPPHAGDVRSRPSTRPALDAAERRTLVGLVPQTAADLLYLETVADECAAADGGSGGTAAPCSTGSCPASTATPTPATSPRASASRSRSPWCSPAPARAPARRADPGARLRRQAGARPSSATCADDGTRSWSRPTTSSSSPRSPTTWSCSPRARSSPSGPVRRVVAESPAFAPQVTKVLGAPWLRVDEVVVARLGRTS